MEPVETEIVPSPDFRTRYVVHTKVLEVKPLDDHWYIQFDGSRESIAFNHKSEHAPYAVGDSIKITFEVEINALPI